VELLKRVKATETEWDQKLRAAQHESEETLFHLRADRDAAVHSALAAADAERARALERARTEIEREVAAILAEGKTAADSAARAEGKRPADQRDRVIAIVLGSLARD
jgi:vacuolar-type H+-ATPase subunit H